MRSNFVVEVVVVVVVMVLMLLVVVAFPSLARILGECSAIHSTPALFFLFFFVFEVEISSFAYINSTLYARISPQWLSELRRLWPNVPSQVACKLVSG